jgi:hypothetical protein
MKPVGEILETARKKTIELGYRGRVADELAYGGLVPVVSSLQNAIVAIQEKLKEEHAWAKDEEVEEDSVDFMKGYAHACNILATSLGIKL